MSNILNVGIKLSRTTTTLKLLNPNVLLKKYVYFTTPLANYVNSSDVNKTTKSIEITTQEIRSLLPDKPKVIPNWRPTPSTDRTNLVHHYFKLCKIRLTTLVVVTAMAGYAVAPAPFCWEPFTFCIIGTGLLSGAANAINQFHEVPFDAQMSRTKQRVLVLGQLTPLHSVMFAAVSSLSGLSILYYGVNGLTASLGLTNLLLYTAIYTPLKRISILNTWVGSIVGAIPPLMGWAACTNGLEPGAWLLAALLYSWQFPHFNALSWNLRPDYSRAGYRMMAVTDPALCRRVALRHTVAIQGMCIAAPVLDVTNWWFLLGATPLNLYFIYLAYNFYKDSSSQSSRKLFRFSLAQLPVLMILFLLSKKKWFIFEDVNDDEEEDDNSEIIK